MNFGVRQGFLKFSAFFLFGLLLCGFCSGLQAQTVYQISITSPAYSSDINGDTTISISAPGFTTIVPRCWKPDTAYGHDSVFSGITLDSNGMGTFRFPASVFPHGPISLRLCGSGNNHIDTCYLQLYNTGGVSWNEGLPPAPPQVENLPMVFADDFDSVPSISATGAGATYTAHTKGYRDFSAIAFCDPTGPRNPFSQRETYLRIRCDSTKNSTGFFSTLKQDGTGFGVKHGYFECRFIAQVVLGAWPAFWGGTYNPNSDSTDEIDMIEGYGQFPSVCQTAWHKWRTVDSLSIGDGVQQNMMVLGGKSNWGMTPHVYGVMITPDSITFYLDNIKYYQIATTPCAKIDPFFPMINYAFGSGWPIRMRRYNQIADMYVDYLRIYQWSPDTLYPKFDVSTGYYTDSVKVTVTAGSGVDIRYTTDGSTPTALSPQYTAPLVLKNTCTLKAMGSLGGVSSKIDSARYTILHHSAPVPVHQGLQYKYYEYDPPRWDSLKNLSALTPVKSGMVDSFTLSMRTATRTSRYAVHFNGAIKIDTTGLYTFHLQSDAGSKLYIDSTCVVNWDGRHLVYGRKSATIALEKGVYPIMVDYFDDTLPNGLDVSYQGPGFTIKKIPKTSLLCDSVATAVQLPVLGTSTRPEIRIVSLRNSSIRISVPLSEAYTLRIMRIDGKTLQTITGQKPAVFTFSKQDFIPGVYIASVKSGRAEISRLVLLQ